MAARVSHGSGGLMNQLFRAGAVALAMGAASPALASALDVTIEGVRSDKGQLVVALYGAGDRQLERREIPARPGAMRVEFGNIAAGEYAVRVFHDEDGDGEMKKTGIGLPAEGYGFSNRAKARFGPPGWKAIAVQVGDGAPTTTAALLRY
jgi:uncharacterized protein (DUF2141 family)